MIHGHSCEEWIYLKYIKNIYTKLSLNTKFKFKSGANMILWSDLLSPDIDAGMRGPVGSPGASARIDWALPISASPHPRISYSVPYSGRESGRGSWVRAAEGAWRGEERW